MNAAHKFEPTYNFISKDLNNPSLLQSFVMSNNADIVKMLEYFKGKINNADEEEQNEAKSVIKRLEALMITRLSITEDIFNTELVTKEVEISSNTEEKEEGGKVIDIHSRKEVKKGKNKKVDQEKENSETKNVPILVKLFPDEKERNIEILHYIEKATKDKKNSYGILKAGLRSMAVEDHERFATDDQIRNLLKWIHSGLLDTITWISPIDVLIENKKVSIADFVKEADNRHKMEGSSEEEIKNLFKPFIVGKELKEGVVAENDEKYETVFKSTMGFIFDESIVKNDPIETKTDISLLDRMELKKWFYTLCMNKPEMERVKIPTAIARMLMEELKKRDENSKTDIAKAIKETLYFLKSHDIDLFNEYMTAHPAALGKYSKSPVKQPKEANTENIENQETEKVDEQEPVTEVETPVEENTTEEVPTENPGQEEKVTETTETSKEKSEEEQVDTPTEKPVETEQEQTEETVTEESVEKEVEKAATESIIQTLVEKTRMFKDTKSISEHLIALFNKQVDPFNRGLSQQDVESYMLAIAKDVLLTSDNEEFHDYKEEDVSRWLGENVIPYITGGYLILSSSNDEELEEGVRALMAEFPSPNEKGRDAHLSKMCSSQLPKNDYLKTFVKKIKKNRFQDYERIVAKINAA